MALKLTKRADSPNWWMRGTVRGISIFESTKTDDVDVAETVRILREKELLDESVFGKKLTVTFAEALQSYLAIGGSNRYVDRLLATFGKRQLRTIKQNDLDIAAVDIYPTGQHSTRNRQLYTPFIAVWNHAVRNDWADLRLWQRPRKPKGTRARSTTKRSGQRPVTYEHAALFVSHMSPAPAMVMTALFYTGMRPIELFSLERSDVSIENRWISLEYTKTGEPRGIPIHQFLVPLFTSLLKRRDKDPHVFRSYRGEPYLVREGRGGQMKGAVRGVRERLAAEGNSINDISPYTARHTVSTQLVINGVHPHIKDQILGHVADDMSRHYTNVPQAPLIDAIDTLPVPDRWRAMAWWSNPLMASREFVRWSK